MSLPKWYALARADLGVKEAPGAADNPVVQAYYRDAGHPDIKHDSVPWCAAFVGAMLTRAGHKSTGSLLARSYLTWGQHLNEPRQGCVVIFPRGQSWQGHVTFVDRVEGDYLVCVGGNQDDAVTEARYKRSEALDYRWPSELVDVKTETPVSPDKFVRCHAVTAKWEGGYVNHPDDPGGATNYGVTQGTYDDYRAGKGLAKRSVKQITADEVREIYGDDYWSRVAGDDLPVGVDLAVYDFGVNSGPDRAVKYLQAVVGSAQDGRVGPKTLKAIEAMDADDIAARLCDARMAFLRGLKTWPTFGRGWTNRVNDVRAKSIEWAVQAMKGQEPPMPDPVPVPKPPAPGAPSKEVAGGIAGGVLAFLGGLLAGVPWGWLFAGVVVIAVVLVLWWIFKK